MRWLSGLGGVAPPRLEGMRALVARWRTAGSAPSGLGERLGVGLALLLVGGARREASCREHRTRLSCSSPVGSLVQSLVLQSIQSRSWMSWNEEGLGMLGEEEIEERDRSIVVGSAVVVMLVVGMQTDMRIGLEDLKYC